MDRHCAYKVPWGSELGEHSILKWIQIAPRRIISYIYDKLLSQQYSPTSGMKAWIRDEVEVGDEPNWNAICNNVF